MSTYLEFLDQKRRVVGARGITDAELPSALYDWQQTIVKWALRKGRAAIFADCGLGKSFMQIAWANAIPGRVLILAPLCVAEQTVREAAKLNIVIQYATCGSDAPDAPITITNYERLNGFDPDDYSGVVLDECFAPNTEIDVLSIDGQRDKKYIKDIHVGETILNASGVDLVADVHRRAIPYAVRLTIAGSSIVCSPNHPWFTREGWRGAMDLESGAEVMATAEAVRMVRDSVHTALCAGSQETILREILLSEMADVAAGAFSEDAQSDQREEARREPLGVAAFGASEGISRTTTDSRSESNERSRRACEDLPHVESDEARSFRAWGQWTADERTAAITAGGTWQQLASGIQYLTGPTNTGLSDALQDRSRRTRNENRDRGGWFVAPLAENSGRQEGCTATWTRVDRLEILEPGHPELERWRDADGNIYFYDLGGTRHPSFSVNGHLVHNSSILKSFDGKTRAKLIDTFKRTTYRLCCTATPSPNDISELANHAEFLGLVTRAEFLASWFVHDDTGWRMKGHAVEPFYRWMASWAVAMRKPSDIGYDDTGYNLPPLRIHEHIVEGDGGADTLFPELGLHGIGGRQKARRGSLDARLDATVNIIDEWGASWLAWCGLNTESEGLARMIPNAIEVSGSDSYAEKVSAIQSFLSGESRVMVTKPKIAGFGLNLQMCSKMVFVGMNDSYETYYQCIRRCWRFGQTQPVDVHIVVSDAERGIVENVRQKEAKADAMAQGLLAHMRDFEREELAS